MINHILDSIFLGDWEDAYFCNSHFDEIFTVAKFSPFTENHVYPMIDGYHSKNYELMKNARYPVGIE